MKVANLVGERFKETPSDCIIESHIFMVRGGYMRYVSNGIYSQLPPLKRICQKVENIIREEMNSIDAQEVELPVVIDGKLWKESGRYENMGKELLKFKDRNDNDMVLGMTHEEAAVHLVREFGQSHQRYPFSIYQIQTKYRDEARPRGGLIRTREFTMKDAYSFHTSQHDLDDYYMRCFKAYEHIYKRVGLENVISVASDSGMMGGNLSHEFMYLTPIGEDSIALCDECGYHANVEIAPSIVANETNSIEDLRLVKTPQIKTIDELSRFLTISKKQICKAVVYQKEKSGEVIVIFMRGDMELNESKLRNYCGEDIHPADMLKENTLISGFIGPYALKNNVNILYDQSLKGANNLVCGANKEDYHYTGLNLKRDCGQIEYHDLSKIKEGHTCPQCKEKSITISRGIEVGNIFQLGDKYTRSMKMEYLTHERQVNYPLMGCYGIGIGRLVAAICEEHHDKNGPVWPLSIAPWQVQICCLRSDQKDVKEIADKLYQELTKKGVEVLYDDRDISAGQMFNDADLFGIPIRVIISPRNIKEGKFEIVARDKSWHDRLNLNDALSYICGKVL